jgi:hypothetical protein
LPARLILWQETDAPLDGDMSRVASESSGARLTDNAHAVVTDLTARSSRRWAHREAFDGLTARSVLEPPPCPADAVLRRIRSAAAGQLASSALDVPALLAQQKRREARAAAAAAAAEEAADDRRKAAAAAALRPAWDPFWRSKKRVMPPPGLRVISGSAAAGLGAAEKLASGILE